MKTNASATYLDSSALPKLVIAEPESAALRRYLERGGEQTTSELALVEVIKAVRMHGAQTVRFAEAVLANVVLLAITRDLLGAAAFLEPPTLRSLDAIHLASALQLERTLEVVVTYDDRMAVAARTLGLPVAMPGKI